MAITESQTKAAILSQAYAVIEARKKLEKEEKSLKDAIKGFMGQALTLEAGDFTAIITSCTTSTINRKSLTEEMGQEFVAKFTNVTTYDKLEIKPAKRATSEVEAV